MVPVGTEPQGDTVGTRINGIAAARPDGGQVIGRSSVDAKHENTVDGVSRELAWPGVRAVN